MAVLIGTAGWSLPTQVADVFPAEGSSLERYAARLCAAEVNSSFHRPHRASTWERWAASVPDDFRFSVKLPKTITHQHKLVGAEDLLAAHLADSAPLGAKLSVHLVQLPPSLAFDADVAASFFEHLAAVSSAATACEPRHPSWFGEEAERVLARCCVARVAADPARVPAAAKAGGWSGLAYFRLHGSPVIYRSSYNDERLASYADRIREAAVHAQATWCIFDNTASSAAAGNALRLRALLERGAEGSVG
jgi:uncharacterized protein YecE (DUF72 family)